MRGTNVVVNIEEQGFLTTWPHRMLYFNLEHIAAGKPKQKNPLLHFSSEEYKPGNTSHMQFTGLVTDPLSNIYNELENCHNLCSFSSSFAISFVHAPWFSLNHFFPSFLLKSFILFFLFELIMRLVLIALFSSSIVLLTLILSPSHLPP